MQKEKRVLLVGGGSGGHIHPNLAIATKLRSYCGPNCGSNCGPNCRAKVLYVGSRSPLDRRLVEAENIPFKSIFAGKLRRYFSWQNFVDPFFILLGFLQSLWIIASFRPHVIFAKGGFVSIPVAFAAFIFRKPIILHESDSVMGLSNKIVAKLAKKICVAFPDVIDNKEKVVFTGNPIRLSIKNGNADNGYRLTGFHSGRPVVLVWGGSQGAQEINKMIEKSFRSLKHDFQIIHITGSNKQTGIQDPSYIQFEYLGKELKDVYAITDLVIGRSGANSLYELAFMQKPNILIPLKSSAHNHQQLNAEYFDKMGAGVMLGDQDLGEAMKALWHNPQKRDSMKASLQKLSRPDAANKIAELILKV